MKSWMTPSMMVLVAALAGCRAAPASNTPPETMLSPVGENITQLTFSPDGSQMAYDAATSEGVVLTVASADNTGAIPLDTVAPLSGIPILWSPDGSQIAYMSGAHTDIWVVPATGGARRQLTASGALDIPWEWDRTGTRLMYFATGKAGHFDSEVLTIATGKSVPLVAGSITTPYWSPDGSRIAYTLKDGDKTTIWVADSIGGHARQLRHEGFEALAGTGNQPSPWSPDGKELLYTSTRTGLADVWVLPVDGDSALQLTRDVKTDDAPVWSPDGKWVAFLSQRGNQTDVWMVPAAGGTPVRVTDNAAVEANLQWVGKSTHVAFTSLTVSNGLWRRSLVDSAERRLTPDSMQVGDWDLSPDGKTLAMADVKGGGVSDLVLIPVDGGSPRLLLSNGASNSKLLWSPDGTKILFVSNKTGNSDVWVVDAVGGAPTDLTGWPGREVDATWSADGKAVYFLADRDAHPGYDLWKVAVAGRAPQRLTRIGTINFPIVDPRTGDVLVGALDGAHGEPILERLTADGKLVPFSEAGTVWNAPGRPFSPSGDTVAVMVQNAKGAFVPELVPTRGGTPRVIAAPNVIISDWSADGKTALCAIGVPVGNLCLMKVKDGTVTRLTHTPDDEGFNAYFLPGDTSVVFERQIASSRIVTVDVAKLMAPAKQ